MVKSNKISLYVDCLIVETIAGNPSIIKNAGIDISGVASSMVNYVNSQLKSENPVASALSLLAPGAILVGFSALGHPWIGALLGLAANFFQIDIKNALSSIYTKISEAVGSGKKLSSSEVDQITQSAVGESTPAVDESLVKKIMEDPKLQPYLMQYVQRLGSGKSDTGSANDGATNLSSITAQKRYARMVKLNMINYQSYALATYAYTYRGYDEGFFKKLSNLLNPLSSDQTKTKHVLVRFLSLFLKIVLASAGLMIVGDVIYSLLGKPTRILNTSPGQPSQPTSTTPSTTPSGQTPASSPSSSPILSAPLPASRSTQTKFPVSSNYIETSERSYGRWLEDYTNNRRGIRDMVLDFAYTVYPTLDTIDENIITSSRKFQEIVEEIVNFNLRLSNANFTSIPFYNSKKEIVDYFIDEVAARAK